MSRTRLPPASDEFGPESEEPVHASERESRRSEAERVLLHMPVDVRSLSLIVVAVIASIVALRWAEAIVVPILLGVMFSYALAPVIDRLSLWHVPRALGAAVVLSSIVALIGWGAWALADDASALVETLPQVAQKVRRGLEEVRRKPTASPLERMQQAANEIEQVAGTAPAAGAASGAARSTVIEARRVVVERPSINVRDYLWTGTLGVFAFLGQLAVVFFVTLFLLASGDTFRRKMVKLAGPRLSQKRITIQALDEVSEHIQRYLVVQIVTSVIVGVATGLAFLALGLDNAGAWGVVAGVTNLVPYVGAALVGAGSALVGFIQFESLDRGLMIGASSFAIHAVVGNLLTPWMTGRASRMSPFAVFVGVLFFGWLWGAVGLILGTPILMAAKTICDRVDELKPVGEILGA